MSRFYRVIARITIFFPRPTPDPQECLELCRDLDGCEYFTHFGEGGGGGGESENLCLGLANCREFSPLSCAECYSGEDACDGMAWGMPIPVFYVPKKKYQRNGLFCKGCFVFHIEFAISLHKETAFPEQDMHKNK